MERPVLSVGCAGEQQVPHPTLVSTVLQTAALYAPFCVHSPSALEAGVVYAVGALRLKEGTTSLMPPWAPCSLSLHRPAITNG